jgi:hypothetical protein
VARLSDYYAGVETVAEPFLFVTCNAGVTMGLTVGATPDYLLMPFHPDFMRNAEFAAKCFDTTAINVRGHHCQDLSLKYWMTDNNPYGWHIDTNQNTADCSKPNGCSFPGAAGSEDSFGFYGVANLEFTCSAGDTSTTNYFVGEIIDDAGCIGSDPQTFDWDVLMRTGVQPEQDFLESYNLDVVDLILHVEVDLKYLGYSSAQGNDQVYGTTYVLDFEDFDAHEDSIVLPGTCENRDADAFTGASFDATWEYSENPAGFGQIAVPGHYLAYPPAGKWDISMAEQDVCGIVHYEGSFSWNDLMQCSNNDKSLGSYMETTDDGEFLRLSGTFYVNVVSPFAYDSDMTFYRVYQVLSAPFIISIAKTVTILSQAGVNLLTMSIIAVYKQDRENTFNLVFLTETADYLMLSRASLEGKLSLFTPAQDNVAIADTDFTVLKAAETAEYTAGDREGCLNNKANICSQLWRVEAPNATCSEDDKYIDFSGLYRVQFTPECRDDLSADDEAYCSLWLNGNGADIEGHMATIAPSGKVLLEATLAWKDEICDPELFKVEFGATMAFYSDSQYSVPAEAPYLFKPGQTIYVEISTAFPDDTYNIFDTDLEKVWLCQFPPGVTPIEIDAAHAAGGCFDGGEEARSRDVDVPFYDVFENKEPDDMTKEKFVYEGHPNGQEESKNVLHFYFDVPSRVSRDKLYVQVQIEVSLEPHAFGTRRLLTAEAAVTNQINHFFDHVGVYDGENEPEPEPKPEPHNYYPQEPIYVPEPVAVPSSFMISLSSPWIVVLGGLLAVILAFNIVFMCYVNCNKRGRVSFDGPRSSYSSVKNVDSEDFNDSEVKAINVSE